MNKYSIILVYLYSFFISFEYIYVVFFGFDSIIKPYRIIAIILIISLFLKTNVRYDKYDKSFLILFTLGFLLALKTFMFEGHTLYYTVNNIIHISIFFFSSIAVKNLNIGRSELKTCVNVFMWGILINIFTIIYFYSIAEGAVFRTVGFFRDPSNAGLSITIFIFYQLYFYGKKNIIHTGKLFDPFFTFLFIFPLSFFSLISTASRTGLAACAISLIFYLIYSKTKIFYKISIFTILLSTTILVFISIDTEKLAPVLGRLTYEEVSQGAGRVDLWKSAFILMEDKPVIGVGLGQYINYSRDYTSKVFDLKNTVVQEYDLSLHNTYLQVIVEFGWLGFLIFFIINFLLFKETYSTYKLSEKSTYSIFLMNVLIIIMIQGIFHSSFILPNYFFFMSLIITHNNIYLLNK